MEKKEKQQNSFDFHISDAIAINESIGYDKSDSRSLDRGQ